MLPTWLTEEYLEPRLRTYYKDDQLKVLKIWAKPATEKGQNYMSLMTRIHVDYQQSKFENGHFFKNLVAVRRLLT